MKVTHTLSRRVGVRVPEAATVPGTARVPQVTPTPSPPSVLPSASAEAKGHPERPGVLHPPALGPLRDAPPKRAPLDLVPGPEGQHLPLGPHVPSQMSSCFWDSKEVPGEVDGVSWCFLR